MTALRKVLDAVPATPAEVPAEEFSAPIPVPYAQTAGHSPALVLLRRVEEAAARNFQAPDEAPRDGSYRPLHVMIGICAVSVTGWLGALAMLQAVLVDR